MEKLTINFASSRPRLDGLEKKFGSYVSYDGRTERLQNDRKSVTLRFNNYNEEVNQ